MSRHDVAKLAFVMAGIYLISESLPQYQAIVWLFATPQESIIPVISHAMVVVAALLPAAVLTTAGLGFIICSGRLASRLFPDQTYNPERILAIPALAYSVVGLVVLSRGLTDIWSSSSRIWMGGSWATPDVVFLVKDVVLIALGIGLFWGSHGLARVWSRLRYAGLRRQMGLCIHCGYDMTGNVSGVCPECGTRHIAQQ